MPTDRDDLAARLLASISGAPPEELRGVLAQLLSMSGTRIEDQLSAARPNLRMPRLDTPAIYRVRVDLDHAKPPIWRRLEVRSDVTLATLHQVLQAAFGWWDYHLYRFAIGGHPFDWHSEIFLCPFEVAEGDEHGYPADAVQLDETLQQPGDVLRYEYDFGDSWDVTVKLEEVLPISADSPIAICVGGRRAAPPEDCGGIVDAAQLAEVLDDPAHFDVAEVNQALQGPFFVLQRAAAHPRLVEIAHQLSPTEDDLARAIAALAEPVDEPTAAEKESALAAHQWFLDRAADGIELTAAGYLKPAVVEEAATIVPAVADWIGAKNREIDTYPLLAFREALQQMKLLRKYRGRLILTKAGAAALRCGVEGLWQHLAAALVPSAPGFEQDAVLLFLADVALRADGHRGLDIAAVLSELDWHTESGDTVPEATVRQATADADAIISNVVSGPRSAHRSGYTPVAAALARAALFSRAQL